MPNKIIQNYDNTEGKLFMPQMEATIEKRETSEGEVVTWWGCWVKGEWRSGLADDYDEALKKVLEHLQSPGNGTQEDESSG